LVRQNPGVFRNTELLTTTTSIDSLSPESPIFPTMLRAPRAPWVHYHNIVGVVSKSSWFSDSAPPSDGVVAVSSAVMEDVESEIMVESKHQEIHSKPRAILEVRRILVNHLRELSQYPQMAAILTLPQSWLQTSDVFRTRKTHGSKQQQQPAPVVQASALDPLEQAPQAKLLSNGRY
jgi:hypothetical protein